MRNIKASLFVVLALAGILSGGCGKPSPTAPTPGGVTKPPLVPPPTGNTWAYVGVVEIRKDDGSGLGLPIPPEGLTASVRVTLWGGFWFPVAPLQVRIVQVLTVDGRVPIGFSNVRDRIETIPTAGESGGGDSIILEEPGTFILTIECWDMRSPAAQGFTHGEGYTTKTFTTVVH